MNQNQVTAGHLTEIIYFTYQNGCLRILRKKWLHGMIMTLTEVKSVQLYFLFNCFLCMQERRCLKLVHSWHYHDQSIPACPLPHPLCRPFVNLFFLRWQVASFAQPFTHACYLPLVPQSSATFLFPKSGIFLFITI